MLTDKEILKKAGDFLKEIEEEAEIELSLNEKVIKKPYGNIFFYNTSKYYRTKNEKYNTLAGNAPFLVERETGKIIEFGTAYNLEDYILEYEAGRWPIT